MNGLKIKKIERATLIILIVIFTLITLYLSGFYFRINEDRLNDFRGRAFGGVVVARTDDYITVRDGRGLMRSFSIVPDTKISKGRETITADIVTSGAYVLVENRQVDGARDEAVSVRVISGGDMLPKKKQK